MKTITAIVVIIIIGFSVMAYVNRNKATETPVPTGSGLVTSQSPSSSKAAQPSSALISNVPFTAQAPFGNWSDPKQENGCEEASSLMAVYWAQGKSLNPTLAEQQILAVSDYEEAQHGNFYDTSPEDTVAWIFKGYFHYDNVTVKDNITAEDIKAELAKGDLVLVPANGQKLHNPHYKDPGPLRHMLVIRGYDDAKNEFITNDPGTRFGELYRYPETTVMDAIYDYPTGHEEVVQQISKSMIVVKPT